MTFLRTSDHDGSDIRSEAGKTPADDLLDFKPRRPSLLAFRPKGSQLDSPGRSPGERTLAIQQAPTGNAVKDFQAAMFSFVKLVSCFFSCGESWLSLGSPRGFLSGLGGW